jgi:hypothetical protein
MYELLCVAPVLHYRTSLLLLFFWAILTDLMKFEFEIFEALVLFVESFSLILLVLLPSELPSRISTFRRLPL